MAGVITGLAQYNTDASPHVDWRDNLNQGWLGTSTKAAIRGRTLDEDGEIKANLLDWIVGNSTEELTNAAMKRKARQMETMDGPAAELMARGKNVSVTASPTKLRKQLNDAVTQEGLISQIRQTGEYKGSTEQLQGMTNDQLEGLLPGLKRKAQATEWEQNPANIYARSQNDIARQDRIAADRRQDKRLAQDRLLTAETNQMQMQLEYARLAQADRQRATDRKDKALMMLIQGLGNLGGAFTI